MKRNISRLTDIVFSGNKNRSFIGNSKINFLHSKKWRIQKRVLFLYFGSMNIQNTEYANEV